MVGKCNVAGCNRDEFISGNGLMYHGACIFHCDKSSGQWSRFNSEEIKTFWIEIRTQTKTDINQGTKKYNFDNYIFPAFEEQKRHCTQSLSENEIIFSNLSF